MSFVLGRGPDKDTTAKPAGEFGSFRALDGSNGAPLYIDFDGPHAVLVVGKRGYGKSYTLGVLAESLAQVVGVAPVVLDPMGVFGTLAGSGETRATVPGKRVPATVIERPTISPGVLDPRSWCALLGLSPESGTGALVWQAAQESSTLAEMQEHIVSIDAPRTDIRAASNHLSLADAWDVFDPAGLTARDLAAHGVTVLDLSGLDAAPMNAVARGVAEALYRGRVDERIDRLPWLLVDEAHTFFDGVAAPALETILTRGRAPGVSLVLATQRPNALSPVAVSQSDIVVSHRLTSRADIEALERARPTYMDESLAAQLPTAPEEVVVVDDATETVHTVTVRRRHTPHGGGSPSASLVRTNGVGDSGDSDNSGDSGDELRTMPP
ncbi:ATP-binding protein [Haloarchaeobius sp. DFWS5]|uniref:ATP-binding protein n=1 Tax=Haloarchaeobius sp. DFWS5 TaxID=3446114 RepID=UPI003EB7D376